MDNEQTVTPIEATEPTGPTDAAETQVVAPEEPTEPVESSSDSRVALADDPEYQKLVRADARRLFKQWKRKHAQRQAEEQTTQAPTETPNAPAPGPVTPATVETSGRRPMALNRILRRGR